MSKPKSSLYTFQFALIICVICSFLLALVSEGLRSKKELNREMDIKRNILKVVDLAEPLPKKAGVATIKNIYDEKIQEAVIDPEGNIVEGRIPSSIEEGEKLYPLFIYEENGNKKAYAFPIIGKGLWSTLYGYLSLEPDAVTVRGLTFYQHGETPGLGAEIEKDWFTDNFKGKKIWDIKELKLEPVAVVKGKVEDKIPTGERDHYVDGISGATMTSKGVTEMVDRELRKYEPYFSKVRK